MDPRMLQYYNRELQHIREMGAEFAREFPKIAGRLGLDGFECADPYVERLLEGFAFLAGRVHLKLDAEFPRFTQHLLEAVYPHYLAPTPSMAVVQFQPDLTEGALADGFPVPRHSVLRTVLGKGDRTACTYRTAQDVTLWPLELTSVEYLPTPATVANIGITDLRGAKAAMRMRLRTTAGLSFSKTKLDRLDLFLRGSDEVPMHIYEQMLGNGVGYVARPVAKPVPWQHFVPRTHIRRRGFDNNDALLPYTARSFQGYRLLHEYFAFPARFMFVSLEGLGPSVQRCTGNELEVVVLLNQSDPEIEHVLDASNFSLFCAPAINLFPKLADRIHLSDVSTEYHVIADRTRPMDYEIYQVEGVTGFGTGQESGHEFLPFYACADLSVNKPHLAYYTVQRKPRIESSSRKLRGPRSSYIGSETFVSIVDAKEAPFSTGLRQLSVNTLCTNRDLPLTMAVGKSATDFTMESGAPVKSVRCAAGPTEPRPSWVHGATAWRLINHLSLNYLSLADAADEQGAKALRELLGLYGDVSEAAVRKQIDGLKSVKAVPVIRRLPMPGPISFGRGLEVTVTFDEGAFEGTGVFLLGAVLDEFFAKYVSMNAFTETVVRSLERGEVMRWPVRMGRRRIL